MGGIGATLPLLRRPTNVLDCPQPDHMPLPRRLCTSGGQWRTLSSETRPLRPTASYLAPPSPGGVVTQGWFRNGPAFFVVSPAYGISARRYRPVPPPSFS